MAKINEPDVFHFHQNHRIRQNHQSYCIENENIVRISKSIKKSQKSVDFDILSLTKQNWISSNKKVFF